MLTRRLFFGGVAGGLAFAATGAHAQSNECVSFTPNLQSATTPDAAIARLKAGNVRFTAGKSVHCDLMTMVKQTSGGQSPVAAIVGCINSRVPPELVFDQHIGDMFCARIAGNFINMDIIGSLEFATKVEGAKAIVVLGHSSCGAIKAAVDSVELGNITAMLKNFGPALATLTPKDGKRESGNLALVQKVVETNARINAAALIKQSAILNELVVNGQLKIVPAVHDLTTGKVTWLS